MPWLKPDYLDAVFGVHRFRKVPQKADNNNHSESESDANSIPINPGIFSCFLLNKHEDNPFFSHFHDRTDAYTAYTSVTHTFFWYFIVWKVFINYTIKFFYFNFYLFLIINRHAAKFYVQCLSNFVPNFIFFNHNTVVCRLQS